MNADKLIHIKFFAVLAMLVAFSFWGMSRLMLVE